MRVSDYFKLGRTQPTLDFVDVDVRNDLRAFIDPAAIRNVESEWTAECVALIQNYFQVLIDCARKGDEATAIEILTPLREPNETHLGLSRGRSKGRALGPYLATEVWNRLKASKAVATGLLEDIEDTMLMIDRIGPDIVSDMTSNIIRGHLITYTQDVCKAVGIPLTQGVDSGPVWSMQKKKWLTGSYVDLPVANGNKLLLVPKIIVRRRMAYDVGEYYNNYILEHLQEIEFNAGSALVQVLKNGQRKAPTKKDIIRKYGGGKGMILDTSLKYPDILAEYRSDKHTGDQKPATHDVVAGELNQVLPDWDALLDNVLAIPVGRDDAPAYEKAIEALLTALFYPWLTHPRLQREIHGGLKRIDLTYSNTGRGVFFSWMAANYPSAMIMVECKNYGGEVSNPELDQLSGRFGHNRGRVGILACRSFEDKARFLRRCKATADDGRGFVIALDDADLRQLVAEAKVRQTTGDFPLLRTRFEDLL